MKAAQRRNEAAALFVERNKKPPVASGAEVTVPRAEGGGGEDAPALPFTVKKKKSLAETKAEIKTKLRA